MIKVHVVCVGKVKEKYFADAISEYKKRLSRFCECDIIEIREENFVAEPTDAEIEKIKNLEGAEIEKRLRGKVVATCIEGEKFTSARLAKQIKQCVDLGEEITFVIGGSYGLSDGVKSKAKIKMSFSDMTFPHTLFRVMLTEQIYRAFMINANSDYHK